jgi:peptidoglycan hydrolase-like protein with peptidoglycan-binding domain
MKSIIPGKKTVLAGACSLLLAFGARSASAADDVVALQNALYGAGYDITSVDGQMGPGTRSALKAFQKDQPNLQASGKLDADTKKALGMVSVELASASTTTATSASSASASGTGSSSSAGSRAQPEPEEDVVEEDDDGGWLFF